MSSPKQPDQARLYYEAHITVAPYPPESDLSRIMGYACKYWDMRVSTFLIFHEDKQPDAFTSMRDTSLSSIKQRLRAAVTYLRHNGHEVKRFKIEDTVLDSKRGDRLP